MITHLSRRLALALLCCTPLLVHAQVKPEPGERERGSKNERPAEKAPPPANQPTSDDRPNNPNVNPLPNERYNHPGAASSSQGGKDGGAPPTVGRGDRRIISKGLSSTTQVVSLAKLAQQRATRPEVKALAAALLGTHQGAAAAFTKLAQDKHIGLGQLDADAREAAHYTDKSGAEFDRAFVERVLDEQDDLIALAERGAQSEDKDLRAAAEKILPLLQDNLRQAEALEKTVAGK